MLKRYCRVISPPPKQFLDVISSKISDQNCGIAILFKIVEKSNNYISGDDTTPHIS